MKPDLSIIIVNFNTKQLLERCLQSIQSSIINHQSLIIELIVVDNGSTDGSKEMVNEQWLTGNVKLIENQQNFGFAKAVNQGLKQAKGEYLLLLNSDVIVKKNSLENL